MHARALRLAALPVAAGLILGGGIVAHRVARGTDLPRPAAASPREPAALIVSSDRLAFGRLLPDRPSTRQLLVRNAGSHPVSLRIEGPASKFTVEPRRLALEPGGIGRVSITAPGDVHGLLRDELRVFTDGSDRPPAVVALEAGMETASGPTGASGHSAPVSPAPAPTETGSASLGPTVPPALGPTLPPDASRAAAPPAVTEQRAAPIPMTRDAATGSPASAPYAGAPAAPVDVAARAPRSMADRPTPPPTADAPLDDETPDPVRRPRDVSAPPADEGGTDEAPAAPVLTVAQQSTVTLLGTRNSFYPQQLAVRGSAMGGSFSLASSLQVPQVPLAFGQSMEFSQQGAAVGSFDPGSGQVSLSLPLQAVDSRGNAAPVVLSLTTGTVMTRNANGVLLSLTGEPRSVQGSLRLVGMGKIPPGYGNGAEEQIVMVEILGNLSFPTTSAARSGAGSGTGAL